MNKTIELQERLKQFINKHNMPYHLRDHMGFDEFIDVAIKVIDTAEERIKKIEKTQFYSVLCTECGTGHSIEFLGDPNTLIFKSTEAAL